MMNKKLAVGLAAAGLISCGTAFAAGSTGEITFVSQGGAYQRAQTKAILNPVAKALNITINQDSAPDAMPMIKTQGMTGKVVWDVVDTPPFNCIRGGRQGLIQKLNFNRLPVSKDYPKDSHTAYSLPYEYYSSVIAYNKKKYGDHPPTSWKDFWNVKKFPGPRALRNYPVGTLEAALLAAGVPRDKLYPLNVNLAFKKLDEIRPYITTWWTSGGQSVQLLENGTVDMIMMWNGRVTSLMKQDPNIGFTFNDGILQRTSLCMLKGTDHENTAYRFINAALQPKYQANLPHYIDYGPANPKAFDTGTISKQLAKTLPSSPENAAKQAKLSYKWWSSPAGEKAQRRWLLFMQQ